MVVKSFITLVTGVNGITFIFIADKEAKYASVLVSGKPFQSVLILSVKP